MSSQNTQNTINTIDHVLAKLSKIEEKLSQNSSILQELKPNWPAVFRQNLERLKKCAKIALEWNLTDTDIWPNTSHTIQRSSDELKVDDIAQYEWDDAKTICRLFNEGWKIAAVKNSNYQNLLKYVREASSFYLDPEISASEIEKYRVRAVASDEEINRLKKELAQALRNEAIIQSVEPQSRYFEEIARACKRSSWRWMGLIFAICAALILLGVCEMRTKYEDNITNQQLFAHVAGRVILLTALLYLLRIASQNYRASEHNRIINTHREKSLKIFSVLVKAVDAKDAQHVVLTKATDAIFGHQISGHDSNTGSKESNDFTINVNADKAT